MRVNKEQFITALRKRHIEIDSEYLELFINDLLCNLDSRLVPNLIEWIEEKEISDIWIGKYCVNAIMSIRGDSDFLGALEAMNTYLQDEQAGISLIWRGRK